MISGSASRPASRAGARASAAASAPNNASVTPDEKASGFQLRFTIEAIVLPGADRDDRLSDAASERLALGLLLLL